MFLPEMDWIKKWSKYTPNRMLVRDQESQEEWTYSEAHKQINSLAWHLEKELGVKKGDRIAVYSPNNVEFFFLFFASMRVGSIMVPLNFRLSPRELDVLISDSAPSLFVYDNNFSEEVKQLKTLGDKTRKVEFETFEPLIRYRESVEEYHRGSKWSEEEVVMIMYTSGTTGEPKGAMINHRNLYWNAINTELRLDITTDDHTQNFAPYFHTGGWNVLVTPFIHHGASHTIVKKFEPDLILDLMEKEKTTLFFAVPTMMQMLADSPKFESVDLSSLRYVVVGGSPMSIPLINKWHEKGVFIRQGYGLTEAGPNAYSLHHDDAIRKRGSIGFPNFYFDVKVVNEEGKELGCEEVGELLLRSPVITPGYWNKPEKTAETIVDGWFHTGDMVKFDKEGFYYVVDRKKNMYISGGENVYPADIERFFLTHEAVKEIAVIGVADVRWGEVGSAFIVLNEGFRTTPEEFLEYCQGKLAKFKIPKYLTIIKEIPKNEAGKVDRAKLG